MKQGATQVLKNLDEAYVYEDADGGASTTLSAAAAKGASTINVTSGTGITAGDRLRIGSGNRIEEIVVGSAYTTGTSVPTRDPLAFAHDDEEEVVERVKVITGSVTDQGVRMGSQITENEIRSATDGFITRLVSVADWTAAWSVVENDVEHAALANAVLASAITGAGTAASPHRLVLDLHALRTRRNLTVGFLGTREDGTRHQVELWGADLNGSGGEETLNTGVGAPTAFNAKGGRKVTFEYA